MGGDECGRCGEVGRQRFVSPAEPTLCQTSANQTRKSKMETEQTFI